MSEQLPYQNILDFYAAQSDNDPLLALGLMQEGREDWDTINKFGIQPLANAEHYSAAKQMVSDNPMMLPSMMASPFGYYLAKKLGIYPQDEYQSDPTLAQVGAGMTGAWHGFTE